MKYARALFLLAMVRVLAGCADHDPWYSSPPEMGGFSPEPSVQTIPVIPQHQSAAETLLVVNAWQTITAEQARDFAGKEVAGTGYWMLVRGLSFPGGGSTTVYQRADGRDIWIDTGVLSHGGVRRVHCPMIVSLSREPSHVFVTASVAE